MLSETSKATPAELRETSDAADLGVGVVFCLMLRFFPPFFSCCFFSLDPFPFAFSFSFWFACFFSFLLFFFVVFLFCFQFWPRANVRTRTSGRSELISAPTTFRLCVCVHRPLPVPGPSGSVQPVPKRRPRRPLVFSFFFAAPFFLASSEWFGLLVSVHQRSQVWVQPCLT